MCQVCQDKKMIHAFLNLLLIFNIIKTNTICCASNCKTHLDSSTNKRIVTLELDSNFNQDDFEINFTKENGKISDCNTPESKMGFLLGDVEDIDNGIKGRLDLNIPPNMSDDEKFSFENLGFKLINLICKQMNYSRGRRVFSESKSKQTVITVPNKRFPNRRKECLMALGDIINERYDENSNTQQTTLEKMKKSCNLKSSDRPLWIKCEDQIIGSQIYGEQTTCSNDLLGQCPLGYSVSKDHNDKGRLCFPNTCECAFGEPVESDYRFLANSCGINFESEIGFDDEDDDGDELTDGADDNDKSLAENRINKPRILKGEVENAKNWPWYVYIYKHMIGGSPHCGGTILNPRFVVTAAHCFYEKTNQLRNTTYVGNTQDDMKKAKELISHEKYDNAQDNSPNDIGLIYLENILSFNHHTRPICMFLDPLQLVGEDAFVLGQPERSGNDWLQDEKFISFHSAELEIFSDSYDKCEASRDGSTFCAGINNQNVTEEEQSPQTCKGDSGSPLMFSTTDYLDGNLVEKWSLIGVLSQGYDCKDESNQSQQNGKVSTFANVNFFKEWIENKITEYTTDKQVSKGAFCPDNKKNYCDRCDANYHIDHNTYATSTDSDNLNECTTIISYDDVEQIYTFFSSVFCDSTCYQYMSCRLKPELEDDNGTDKPGTEISKRYEPMFNECTCKNGEPTTNCPSEFSSTVDKDNESCNPDKCDEFHHYNSPDRSCNRNVCTCLNKDNLPKIDCPLHGQELCENDCSDSSIIIGSTLKHCSEPLFIRIPKIEDYFISNNVHTAGFLTLEVPTDWVYKEYRDKIIFIKLDLKNKKKSKNDAKKLCSKLNYKRGTLSEIVYKGEEEDYYIFDTTTSSDKKCKNMFDNIMNGIDSEKSANSFIGFEACTRQRDYRDELMGAKSGYAYLKCESPK